MLHGERGEEFVKKVRTSAMRAVRPLWMVRSWVRLMVAAVMAMVLSKVKVFRNGRGMSAVWG